MEFVELIGNFGFPMACAIAMALYVKNVLEKSNEQSLKIHEEFRIDAKEREAHYRQHQKEMVVEMGKISTTIDRINDRLEDIEQKVFDK